MANTIFIPEAEPYEAKLKRTEIIPEAVIETYINHLEESGEDISNMNSTTLQEYITQNFTEEEIREQNDWEEGENIVKYNNKETPLTTRRFINQWERLEETEEEG